MSLKTVENEDTSEPLSVPNFSKRQKLNIKKDIEKLEYNEHCELFKIIMEGTDKVTINNGGVFLNMKNLNDQTLVKIQKFIEFTKENKKLLNAPRLLPISNIETQINQDNKMTDNQYNNFSYDILTSEKENIDAKENNEIETNKLETNKLEKEDLSIIDKLQKNPVRTKNDNFKFQSYIEKLQSSNNKSFPTDLQKKMEITLKQNKIKLSGWNARIMKRCRDYNIDRLQPSENMIDKNKTQNQTQNISNISKTTNINMKSILKKVKNDEEIINELLDDEDAYNEDIDDEDIDDTREEELDIEEEVILI